MSGWTNPDVTPGGWAGGGPGSAPPASGGPVVGAPLQASPGRGRGWVRVALGAVVLVGGIGLAVAGLVGVIATGQSITDDAVAGGTTAGGETAPATFTAPEAGDYTVYVLLHGIGDENRRDRAVASTSCEAGRPTEGVARFTGARQAVSNQIGDAGSVGWFSTGAGRVTVRCVSSRTDFGPEGLRYVVTPGKPSIGGGGIALLVGGIFVAVAGGFLLAWGAWGGRGGRRILR